MPGNGKTAQKPSSIERIQRLERLEWERLEGKRAKEERRRQAVAANGPIEPDKEASIS